MQQAIPYLVVKSFALLFLVACASSSELTLAAPKSAIADGLTAVVIHATAKFRGTPVADGTTVHFTTSAGSFSTTESVSTGEAETTGGIALIQLQAPNKVGIVTVTASFANPNGETVTASAKIVFGTAPPADARSLGWSCAAGSLSARVSGVINATTDCTLSLKDAQGAPQPAGDVGFFSEAGTLSDAGVIGSARHATYVASVGDAPPIDVSPLAAEQDYTTAVAGVTHNPRDMLASLLVVVVAQEQFTDLNGNGRYDENEPFIDEAEPFIDVDDDGVFTPGSDIFLPVFDVNGNGQWDSGNGVWDASTKVGRTTHVLWVGDATLTAVNQQVSVGAAPGLESFLLVDDYGNPPAGFASGDATTIAFDNRDGVLVTGLGTTPIGTTLPMSFSASGVFAGLTSGRRFDITITDTRAAGAAATTVQLTAAAVFTPAVAANQKNLTAAATVTIAAKGM